MHFKNYPYEEDDGMHFPDGYVGDVRVYELDFSKFLEEEKGELVTASWTVDPELELFQEQVNINRHVAQATVSTPQVGSYHITCVAVVQKDVDTEVVNVPMVVKVF